ncbi:hypothetical protein BD410DRAFT_798328 [Rickenella mellea]|uniref:Hydrophobin n=1 Tax=Rickenella mellea TaxID=50990 RepID=A0A4R5XHD2_9AGAM|nr:hypothetical protein BD410DRAFT_798328 [Rickenella mellea]
MRPFEIIAVTLAGLSTTAFAQIVQPTCSEGGGTFKCSDAAAACELITTDPIRFDYGTTSMKIAGSGSADVWLTRSADSSTLGDMNGLCKQVVAGCCKNVTTDSISKSKIAFMKGEIGSLQIVPA